MKIIGIGGTNGSGKDTLSHILEQYHDWLFVSTSRDLIIPELKKRGLPIERENMAALTKEWRQQAGKSVVIAKAVEKFELESKTRPYKGMVISSLRHPWEVDRLHELGGILVWIDADPKIRYQRIHNRGQGSKDIKTFEQFLAEEKAEMTHLGDDVTTLNVSGVKDLADVFLVNDTDDIEAFRQKAEEALKQYMA